MNLSEMEGEGIHGPPLSPREILTIKVQIDAIVV